MESEHEDKLRRLEDQIKSYEEKKERLKKAVRDILGRQKSGSLSYTESVYRINNFMEGKSAYEWMNYYDQCKAKAYQAIAELKKSEQASASVEKKLVESWKNEKLESVKNQIGLYNEKQKKLGQISKVLEKKRDEGALSYSQYQYILNNFREGKPLRDWVSFYDERKKQAYVRLAELESQTALSSDVKEEMLYSSVKPLERILRQDLVEKKPREALLKPSSLERKMYRVFGIVIVMMISMSLFVILNPNMSTVAMAVLGVDSVYTQPFSAYVDTDTDFSLSADYLGELRSFKLSGELLNNGSVEIYLDGMLVFDKRAYGDSPFVDVCEETCNFRVSDKEDYNLSLKVRRGEVRIDTITYSIKRMGEESEGFDVKDIEYPDFKVKKLTLSDIEKSLVSEEQVLVCDLNKDERNDLVVGNPSQGKVYVWYGGLTPDLEPHITLKGDKGFGYALDCADINYDKFDDMLVWNINAVSKDIRIWNGGRILSKEPDKVFETTDIPRSKRTSVFADMNDDGVKDLISLTGSGLPAVWYGSKNGFLDNDLPSLVLKR